MKIRVIVLIIILCVSCKEEAFDEAILKQKVIEYEDEYEEYFTGYEIDPLKIGRNDTEYEVKRFKKVHDRAIIDIKNIVIIRNFYYSDTINIEFVNKFKLTGAKRLFSNNKGTHIVYTTSDSLYFLTNMDYDSFSISKRNYKFLYGDWKYYSQPW